MDRSLQSRRTGNATRTTRSGSRASGLKEAIVSKKGVQGKQLMPHQIAAKFMHGSRPSSLETEVLPPCGRRCVRVWWR